MVLSHIQIEGEADVSGKFGFLGVEVKDPTIALKDGVEVRLDLLDPSGDGYLTAEEIATGSPASLISAAVFSPTTPGPAVTFTANLEVLAQFAGLNLSLAKTPITVTWDSFDGETEVYGPMGLAAT